jgi:hypothetical protein
MQLSASITTLPVANSGFNLDYSAYAAQEAKAGAAGDPCDKYADSDNAP